MRSPTATNSVAAGGMVAIIGGMLVVTVLVSRASLLRTAAASTDGMIAAMIGRSTALADSRAEMMALRQRPTPPSPVSRSAVAVTLYRLQPAATPRATPAPRASAPPTPAPSTRGPALPVVSASPTPAPTPTPTPTPPPPPMLLVTPSAGSAPLLITADASRWIDPNGNAITDYAFDFGDGSTADNGDGLATHTYNQAGTFRVQVTITDSAGLHWTATRTVTVG